MDRRGVLKSVISTVGGAGLIAASGGALAADEQTSRVPPTKGHPVAYIESRDGVGLFYRDWGTGSPLVFLAPWGMDSDWWQYQAAYLVGQGLRCIAYDRRGHGRSVEPSSGYDFDTLADDLNEVIERLDLHGVTLVGHSMGCREVVRYLSRHGAGRIARIAMVAPNLPMMVKTADNPDGVDRRLLEEADARLSKDCPRQMAVAASAFFNARVNPVSAELMQWWANMVLKCSLRVLLDLRRLSNETDFRSELTKISLPTVIIHGDSDTSAPIERTGRKTAKLISGSQLKVYEGAGHGLPITHMDRLNQDLLAFARS
ncbi:MAG: alpha/beta hydrolase [Bradyrhizobium sp.]|nr:alpha/beta hydrolase [Bradyrhizobium sp.]